MTSSKKAQVVSPGSRTDEAHAPFVKKVYRRLGILFAGKLKKNENANKNSDRK